MACSQTMRNELPTVNKTMKKRLAAQLEPLLFRLLKRHVHYLRLGSSPTLSLLYQK